jgi:hypothetical protein
MSISFDKWRKEMKTKVCFTVLFVFLTGSVLMFSGCVTNKGVYDPSVPPEQLCTLNIDSTVIVRQFDGNAVKWYDQAFGFSTVVKIPAGYHEFISDYISGSRHIFWAEDIRYSYTFEAGKSYVMDPLISDGSVSIQIEVKE